MTPEEIDKYRHNVCKQKPKIQSHQAFLSEFMNPETPYTGLLIFHGTGSGKTFASVSIAERFREQVTRYNTRILILVPGPILKEQFKTDLVTVCTNFAYMPSEVASQYHTMSPVEKKRAVDGALLVASQYYRIMSYKSFHKRVMGEKRTRDDKSMRIFSSNRLESLDNTLLIVDEAHNFTNNEYGQSLMQIKQNSENLRIVLLTATPMKNLADEIVPLLNFVRPIDDPIEKTRVFQGTEYDMTFVPNGKYYLYRMASGYVSYYRGGDPYTFATRKDMGDVPDDLLFTPLVRCPMMPFQEDTYRRVTMEFRDALDKNAEAAANFVFPALDSSGGITGVFGKNGMNEVIQQTASSALSKKVAKAFSIREPLTIFYAKNTKTISGAIFSLPYLRHFSSKFAAFVDKLTHLTVGTAFVYSNIVLIGTSIIREVLLANGFLEYNAKGRYVFGPNTRSYDMQMTYTEFVHRKQKGSFKPATFIVVSGSNSGEDRDVPEEKIHTISKVFNSPDNTNGELIKVVVGSRVVNEGVTLENVRQIHIVDVHYHLGRVDQVIGRAIRQCRHIRVTQPNGAPSPSVEVYRYVVSYKDSSELTREELMYKRAETKYVTIKEVERILKEGSIDCPLNFAANQVAESLLKKDCKSVHEVLENPALKNQLCPAQCEFHDCRFKCGDHTLNLQYYDRTKNIYKNIMKSHMDFGTFSKRNARLEVDFCKAAVKELYRLRDSYSLDFLRKEVLDYYDDDKKDLYDDFFLLRALTELMPITDGGILNFTDFVVNRFNETGYIVFRNGWYTFQSKQNKTNTINDSRTGVSEYLLFSRKKDKKERYVFDEQPSDKKDNFIVGVIDDDSRGNEVFKIRPPRTVASSRKRIPSVKGSVCSFSRSIEQLTSILKKLGVKTINNSIKRNRQKLCELIKERLLYLQLHAGKNGIPDRTYMIIPTNHPIRNKKSNKKSVSQA